jgi:hypothetical protein
MSILIVFLYAFYAVNSWYIPMFIEVNFMQLMGYAVHYVHEIFQHSQCEFDFFQKI